MESSFTNSESTLCELEFDFSLASNGQNVTDTHFGVWIEDDPENPRFNTNLVVHYEEN